MKIREHNKITGFSGNEIYCLKKLNYNAGQICLGNDVLALGVGRGIGASLSTLAGGEVEEVTKLVHDGRKNAFERMMKEATHQGGVGLAGVSFEMINHGGNIEFIAVGSVIRDSNNQENLFSTSASAQELYCQIDSGFTPHKFVFGNVAYSIGVGGSIKGMFRRLIRGEVPQFTTIFDKTRHLALTRIADEAKAAGANSVIGIKTSISFLLGTQEMMMVGTASSHPALGAYSDSPVTSDMTNEELWNLVNIGYMPIKLVMGVSVYSLGLSSGIFSIFKTIIGGKIETLTELLYEARQKAFERIEIDAEQCGADEVVGVKTYVYDLGGGLVEFLVIGTAVKKVDGITTKSSNLIPQAIIKDEDTFIDSGLNRNFNLNNSGMESSAKIQSGPITILIVIFIIAFYVITFISNH